MLLRSANLRSVARGYRAKVGVGFELRRDTFAAAERIAGGGGGARCGGGVAARWLAPRRRVASCSNLHSEQHTRASLSGGCRASMACQAMVCSGSDGCSHSSNSIAPDPSTSASSNMRRRVEGATTTPQWRKAAVSSARERLRRRQAGGEYAGGQPTATALVGGTGASTGEGGRDDAQSVARGA